VIQIEKLNQHTLLTTLSHTNTFEVEEGVSNCRHKRFITHKQLHHSVSECVLLCFIRPILGNCYVQSQGFIVSEPRETHSRSEIADVPTSLCLPLDNLGCPDPLPSPQLRRWLYRSPPLPLRTDPASTTLTTRGLCPGDSVVWAGPKFVRPHW